MKVEIDLLWSMAGKMLENGLKYCFCSNPLEKSVMLQLKLHLVAKRKRFLVEVEH